MAQMTQTELEEIIEFRYRFERCPNCDGVSVEFAFNVLDSSAPKEFTARCRSCGYTMHDNEREMLLSRWNAEIEQRIDR